MAKNSDILFLVEALSNEKGIDQEIVFESLELALASVLTRDFEENVTVRVDIDRESGAHKAYRYWTVVPDNIEDLVGDMESEYELMPDQQIKLTEAKKIDENLALGDVVDEEIEAADFGRISAQQAKQIIIQKVRGAERDKLIAGFEKRIGEIVTGMVKRVTRDSIIIDLGGNAEGLMPREQMIPREIFRVNDRVRGYLYETREERRGPQVMVSRIHPKFLVELFTLEVPEISEEVIQIKAAARDAGSRAKIAVKTNDGRIDPIGACVGMRGSRVQAVSNELNGERVDVILWDDNPAQLVINALAPAEVASIVADEEKKTMDIAVAEEQLSIAIGRAGQNVRLASELTGWTLNIMSEKDASDKQATESEKIKAQFIADLDLDEAVAAALVGEGFSTLEEVAYVPPAELKKVPGFTEETVTALQARASDILLTRELAGDMENDITVVDGMTEEIAATLEKHEIKTREDLAELAVFELEEMGIDAELAAKLIMSARAHWFDNE